MTLHFKIEGKYENGNDYYDAHYDVFELAELLDTLTSGNRDDVKSSDAPIPETLKITTINEDGDEV